MPKVDSSKLEVWMLALNSSLGESQGIGLQNGGLDRGSCSGQHQLQEF